MMKSFLVGAALVASAAGASAQVYMGSSVGWAKFATQCDPDAVSCDKSSAGYRVHVGYDDTAKIAGELGYLNFGKIKLNYNDGYAESAKASAVTLGLAFRADLGRDVKGVLRIGAAGVSITESTNDGYRQRSRGMNPYLGLGLEYNVLPNVKAIGALDMTRGKSDNGNSADLYLLSAGVQYHF